VETVHYLYVVCHLKLVAIDIHSLHLPELPDWQHTISGTDIRALFISGSSI